MKKYLQETRINQQANKHCMHIQKLQLFCNINYNFDLFLVKRNLILNKCTNIQIQQVKNITQKYVRLIHITINSFYKQEYNVGIQKRHVTTILNSIKV